MTAETTIPDLVLAGDATYEEAAYLLLYKHIPKRSELIAFRTRLAKARTLPLQVIELIRILRHARPMTVLRTAISALGAVQEQKADRADRIDARERLIARLPVIMATHQAFRSGLPVPVPHTGFGYSRNLLAMLGLEHDDRRARMTDLLLITQAESGAGAAAFTARVVAKTQADVYSAISAALGALDGLTKGPTERFLAMVDEIGEPARVEEYLRAKRIPAFANEDPRARHLKAATQELGPTTTLAILEELARFGADPGINGYAIALAQRLGLLDDLVVPLSAVSRIAGWLADVDDELGGTA
jgi:citrate synthase